MEFRIADTFTDSLSRLTADEQKAVKTTAFDLQANPAMPGLQFHKLDKAKDKRFWSVRASSDIPVVSAVGHETDFTIADFVADLRAPTPSAAAEIVTAAQHRIEERVQSLEARLLRAVRFQQMHARQRFLRTSAEGAFARLSDSINRRHQRVDSARFRLEALSQRLLQARAAQLRQLSDRLHRQDVHRRVLLAVARQQHLQQRLERTAIGLAERSRQRLERAEARLHALSPTAILERGYALVYREDGTLLRDVSNVREGDVITAQVAHGTVRAIVNGRNP